MAFDPVVLTGGLAESQGSEERQLPAHCTVALCENQAGGKTPSGKISNWCQHHVDAREEWKKNRGKAARRAPQAEKPPRPKKVKLKDVAYIPPRKAAKKLSLKPWKPPTPDQAQEMYRNGLFALRGGRKICGICSEALRNHGNRIGVQDHDHRFKITDPRGWRDVLCGGCNGILRVKAERLGLFAQGPLGDYLKHWEKTINARLSASPPLALEAHPDHPPVSEVK